MAQKRDEMEIVRLAAAGPASRLATGRRLQSDEEVLKTLAGIVDKKSKTSNRASRGIQELSIAFRDHQTANSILIDCNGLIGSSVRT